MPKDETFRDEVRAAIRRNDPSAEELLTLADDLVVLAERYEVQEEIL